MRKAFYLLLTVVVIFCFYGCGGSSSSGGGLLISGNVTTAAVPAARVDGGVPGVEVCAGGACDTTDNMGCILF